MDSRNHLKLRRLVLVQNTRALMKHRIKEEGFEFMNEESARELFEDINKGFFLPRYGCEEDTLLLQTIPYVLFFGSDRTVVSYVRSTDIESYGEKRLFGKHSLGVGGHIREEDRPNYILGSLEREVDEEVLIRGNRGEPQFVGTLFSRERPVDEVHFGLIYGISVDGIVVSNEESLVKGEMVSIDQMKVGYHSNAETETWTKLLIPHLTKIYDLSLPNQ